MKANSQILGFPVSVFVFPFDHFVLLDVN